MVDFTGFLAAVSSDFCLLGSFLGSADNLSDARLFGAGSGAGADAGAARDDRRGMAKETWKTLDFSSGCLMEGQKERSSS